MHSVRPSVWIGAAFSLFLVCRLLWGQETPNGTPAAQPVMQAKLAHTRKLIEALVSADFPRMDSEAKEMAAVARLAAWSRHDSPAYQAESFEFEGTLHLLRELARRENAKGAALACVTLTLNCVDCHQTLRAAGAVQLDDITVPVLEDNAVGETSDASVWMRRKLDGTEQALAGLVAEDFTALQQSAASMRKLGRIEAWSRRRSIPRYDLMMDSFNFACDELAAGAREENIESATLAFTQLLLSCVNCHEALRAAGE